MASQIIEKQINILDYSLSSLWRKKLKNLSVILVFTAVIFLIASFQMITRSLTSAAEDALAYAPEITIQKLSVGRQESIPLNYIDRLSVIFGIRQITPRIWGYYFDENNGANYTVMAMDTTVMPKSSGLSQTLQEGSLPGPADKGMVVIGRSVLKAKGLGSRRSLSLFRPDLSLKSFKVSGIFNEETDIMTNDLMVMTMADARDLFAIPSGLATDLLVYVSNPAEVATIAKKISEILPGTRVLTRQQIQKTYKMVFGWRSGFASVCLLTALAAFVILAWDKASGLSPDERREIGILKVIGWETSDILAVRFWEGLLVAIVAFVMGCTLAYMHVAFFEAVLFRPILVGWSVIYPPFRLPPGVELGDLLLIFSFSVLPYLAATVIPAWRCAIVPANSAIK